MSANDPRLQQGLLGLTQTLAWEMNHWENGKFVENPLKMKGDWERNFWNSVDCCCLRTLFQIP
jgi:hypothetical protein